MRENGKPRHKALAKGRGRIPQRKAAEPDADVLPMSIAGGSCATDFATPKALLDEEEVIRAQWEHASQRLGHPPRRWLALSYGPIPSRIESSVTDGFPGRRVTAESARETTSLDSSSGLPWPSRLGSSGSDDLQPLVAADVPRRATLPQHGRRHVAAGLGRA